MWSAGDPRWIPEQRPVTRSFDVFFDLRLNKRLRKQSWGWWLEMLSRPLWRHHNYHDAHVVVIDGTQGFQVSVQNPIYGGYPTLIQLLPWCPSGKQAIIWWATVITCSVRMYELIHWCMANWLWVSKTVPGTHANHCTLNDIQLSSANYILQIGLTDQ